MQGAKQFIPVEEGCSEPMLEEVIVKRLGEILTPSDSLLFFLSTEKQQSAKELAFLQIEFSQGRVDQAVVRAAHYKLEMIEDATLRVITAARALRKLCANISTVMPAEPDVNHDADPKGFVIVGMNLSSCPVNAQLVDEGPAHLNEPGLDKFPITASAR